MSAPLPFRIPGGGVAVACQCTCTRFRTTVGDGPVYAVQGIPARVRLGTPENHETPFLVGDILCAECGKAYAPSWERWPPPHSQQQTGGA